ncbi:MAG: DUF1349 domain-containing protein [Candidatus Hodarchaeota archaeon]
MKKKIIFFWTIMFLIMPLLVNSLFKLNYNKGDYDFFNGIRKNSNIFDLYTRSIDFTNFSPNETLDLTPNCEIYVQDLVYGLDIDSEYFAYSRDGSTPTEFMNPHNDNFNDGVVGQFWRELNPDNGIIEEKGGVCNITDTGDHNWHSGPGDANALVHTITSDFDVTVKVSTTVLSNPDQAGILVRQDDNNFIKVVYIYGQDGNINVAFWKTVDGIASNIAHPIVGLQSEIYLRLEREGDTWLASYSTTGYVYTKAGSTIESFSNQMDVGIFVGSGITANFDGWTINPNLGITGTDGSTDKEKLTAYNVPFNQIHGSNNKIRFRLNNTNSDIETSATYTVNTSLSQLPYEYHPENTLYGASGNIIREVNWTGHTVWSYDASWTQVQSVVDVERLANGNTMFVAMNSTGQRSAIIEVNDSGGIEWIFNPDGTNATLGILDWTHDADLLPNGNVLIADTGNDRVIVVTRSGDMIWEYNPGISVMDYPNDADLLPNGNILIDVRDLDKVIEVNYTTKSITWEYNPGSSMLEGPHNADRLPNGNTIVCDSRLGGDGAIIELNSTTKETVWYFNGKDNGSSALKWPRDADRLSNGNTLIADSNNFRIIEINTSGHIIWELSTSNSPYCADRVNSRPPDLEILSPINQSYNTNDINITLLSNDYDVDTMFYSLYNWSDGTWVDMDNKTYTESEIRTLGDGYYALYAWVNDTGIYEGSWDWMNYGQYLSLMTGPLKVNFTVLTRIPQFSNFSPEQTMDTTPDVHVNVSDSTSGLDIGTEQFGYVRDGTTPTRFMNPHEDDFNDGSMAQFWSYINKINGTFTEAWGMLNISDNGNHDWSENRVDAPTIIQTICDDFSFDIKINVTLTQEQNVGLLLYCNDSNYLKVVYSNTSFTTVNVSFWKVLNKTSSLIESCEVGALNPIWLRMTRIDNHFSAFYSTTGQTYEIYEFIGQTDIEFAKDCRVGVFAANGSEALFDNWRITPHMEITGTDGSTTKEKISVYNVPFKEFHEINNKIKFKISNLDTLEGESPTYTVNISTMNTLRDRTLYPDADNIIKEVDRFGNIKWSYDAGTELGVFALGDVERLPNGDTLFIDMEDHGDYSAVFIINSTGGIVWNYTPSGADRLDWAHDADVLPNGNMLIADTGNNRILEVNYNTKSIVWSYNTGLGSYPNDCDRLPNGHTLITLRDWDQIIEINGSGTYPDNITWIYGEDDNFTLLDGPHNADRLKNNNTIIADSNNDRIIEVNLTGHVVWNYTDTDWPRDADKLTTGNILIADTDNYRIIEINYTTKEIVWQKNTYSMVTHGLYCSDRLDTYIPETLILSPLNQTYNSRELDVILSSISTDVDQFWFRVYDTNESQWQTPNNVTWTEAMCIELENLHIYEIYAWCNDSGSTDSLGSDSFSNYQVIPTLITFYINMSSPLDSNKPFPGNTLISHHLWAYEITPEGQSIWSWTYGGGRSAFDLERLPNGNIQASPHSDVVEINSNGEVIWSYRPPDEFKAMHDADRLPNGNIICADTVNDRVLEVNISTNEIVWSWYASDHFIINETTCYPYDWAHLNDVDRLPNGNTLISLRNLFNGTVIEVDPVGNIVWQTPQGLLYGQHNPDKLINGNMIIADSMNKRIIEINTSTYNIVWEYNYNLTWPRDADLLPNGNILITDKLQIIEVNRTKDIVWEFYSSSESDYFYEADRLNTVAPTIDVISPINNGIYFNCINITLNCNDYDLDKMWYRIQNNESGEWVDTSDNLWTEQVLKPLWTANYSLYVWANDTGFNTMLGSDDHSNTLDPPKIINFTVKSLKLSMNPNPTSGNIEFQIQNYTNLKDDYLGVNITCNGSSWHPTFLGYDSGSSTWSYSWNIPIGNNIFDLNVNYTGTGQTLFLDSWFIGDTIAPIILLNSLNNESILQKPNQLELDIADINLNTSTVEWRANITQTNWTVEFIDIYNINLTTFSSNQAIQFWVRANDTAGNQKLVSIILTFDDLPPTKPSNPSYNIQTGKITLSWVASADDNDVMYHILRNGIYLGNTTETFYVDPEILEPKTYIYEIIPIDEANNTGESLFITVKIQDTVIIPPILINSNNILTIIFLIIGILGVASFVVIVFKIKKNENRLLGIKSKKTKSIIKKQEDSPTETLKSEKPKERLQKFEDLKKIILFFLNIFFQEC